MGSLVDSHCVQSSSRTCVPRKDLGLEEWTRHLTNMHPIRYKLLRARAPSVTLTAWSVASSPQEAGSRSVFVTYLLNI